MKNIPVRSIKAAEAKPNISESFKIRTVTDILVGKDMVQDLHRHDFYFVLALKKGSGNHEIDFVSHTISDNSVFLMRPGQVHRLELKSRSKGYLMEFGKNFFNFNDNNHIFRKAANKNFCQLEPATSDKLQTILASIHDEYLNQHDGFEAVIKASLSIFFIKLGRRRQHTEISNNTRSDYAQERLHDFFALVESDIATHKQVSYYADKLNLSSFQLNSITKTLMGKTAAELIDDHILLESKRYLLATSNQVNQIAYHLGYEDVSYFIRFFKKHTGFTPEMFRQNLR
ncbi:MAG TPA: AraC family transcriptional regulator [Chryseosolibacter sp.]|nr:AraC family transcriptional regulator [Chryseosolibacter sp.]